MTIQRQSGWPPEAHGWKYLREILKIFLCGIFSNTSYSLPGNGGRGQPCGIFHSRRRDRCGQRYGGRPSSCLFRFWKVGQDAWTWPGLIWLDGWMDQNFCLLCIWQERPTGVGQYGDDYWRWPSRSASQRWQRYIFASFNSVQHQRYHGPWWLVKTSRRLLTELLGIQPYMTRYRWGSNLILWLK